EELCGKRRQREIKTLDAKARQAEDNPHDCVAHAGEKERNEQRNARDAQHEVVRGKRADRHERRGAERKLSRVTGEQIEAERGERKNQERNQDRGEPVLIRGERNDDERDGESSDHRDSVLPNRKDLLVLGVCRLELPGFAVKHMAPVIPRFYGSCQAPSESCGIESSAMAIDRECDAYKFAGKNNGSLDGGQSACPIAFVQRTPQFRFAGGTSSVKQQPPQLSRAAFRQTAPSDALPG